MCGFSSRDAEPLFSFFMATSKIEENWEEYGKQNAYYAVLTEEKYRDQNLNESVLADFFASGEEHATRVWTEIETHLTADFRPRRGLDFGCGVGRLTIPLARRCGEIIGVDIAENMLVEARRNCERQNIANAEFVKGDDDLSRLAGEFDFIHSFIVFQHIKPELGLKIAEKMIQSLATGGIGVLHFTYKNKAPLASQRRVKLYRAVPFLHKIRNLVLRRNDDPLVSLVPMNVYSVNEIFDLLRNNDCHTCSVRFSDHNFDGAVFFFRKGGRELF